MALLVLTILALVTIAAIALYVYVEVKLAQPMWRRLPAQPGLPPDMEYQCWSAMVDFDANALSDAVVLAVDLLSPVYGRRNVFSALKGARLLIYRDGTYPGSECGPAVAGVVLTPRWSAVEMQLIGVAHALAHLVERHCGAPDYAHASWDRRGITAAVFTYEERRRRYTATYG